MYSLPLSIGAGGGTGGAVGAGGSGESPSAAARIDAKISLWFDVCVFVFLLFNFNLYYRSWLI